MKFAPHPPVLSDCLMKKYVDAMGFNKDHGKESGKDRVCQTFWTQEKQNRQLAQGKENGQYWFDRFRQIGEINGFNIACDLLRIVSISRNNLLCYKKLYKNEAFSGVGSSGPSNCVSSGIPNFVFMLDPTTCSGGIL